MTFSLSPAGLLRLFQAGAKISTLAAACEKSADEVEDALREAINDELRRKQNGAAGG